MDVWDMLDQAQAETQVKSLLPEGTYRAVISNVTITESSNPEANEISCEVEYTILDTEFARRKAWWSFKLSSDSSPKKLSFVKSQICKMSGLDSTSGKPMELLIASKGNEVEIAVKHTPGIKDPTKTYLNVYCQSLLAKAQEAIPF